MKSFEVVQNVLTSLIIPFLGIIVGIAAIPGVKVSLEARLTYSAKSIGLNYCTGISLGLACSLGVTLVLLSGLLGGLFRPSRARQIPSSFICYNSMGLVNGIPQSSDTILAHAGSFFVGTIYYRMAGAKIGAGCQINSPI